jgi:precorrin-2 dehydrogenase/sirohydrochlorin ferrochelatase
MALFPMFVKLEGRRCVVVGAGRIAIGKIATLLRAGAQVTVISPEAEATVRRYATRRRLVWRRREFLPSDVANAFLVIAASNSAATNQAVFRACTRRGVLCNAVDDPEHCDFFYPAVIRRGPLQIAISTAGCSPALARRLRRDLQQQFGPEYASWVRQVAKSRREILARQLAPRERRKLLQQIASREAFESFARRQARRSQQVANSRNI